MSAAAPAPARTRRQRSVTESLLSIVLVLEATVLFFATLVAFGLRAVDPALALIGGAASIVLLVITAMLVRYRWGVWFGWVLQAALIATGILVPLMYGIGALFAAIWIYCFVRARQLDRQKEQNP